MEWNIYSRNPLASLLHPYGIHYHFIVRATDILSLRDIGSNYNTPNQFELIECIANPKNGQLYSALNDWITATSKSQLLSSNPNSFQLRPYELNFFRRHRSPSVRKRCLYISEDLRYLFVAEEIMSRHDTIIRFTAYFNGTRHAF